jgi:NADPH:quinone reductase-like Zn-dependent oxidoreductase
MNRRTTLRALGISAFLVTAAAVSLVVFATHNTPCGPASVPPANAELMKAVDLRCYGPPDVLRLENIEKPTPAPDQVLVKVHATSVNPLEWHMMRGSPYLLMRRGSGFGSPKEFMLGVDYAGTVEAVGTDVNAFKPGDEVFGGRIGAFAEYVVAREAGTIVHKPPSVSFEQAGVVHVAGITALQALRDWGRIRAGQKVLVNGASGGVGTFAVQIAKAYGAEVTGVCSTRNVELVRSIGADHVIDYKKEDFTEGEARYDLIVDMIGNHSLLELRGVLQPDGAVVIVGYAQSRDWLGSSVDKLEANIVGAFVSQRFMRMRSDPKKEDMLALRELMQAGKVVPVIDRRYALHQLPAAIEYLETGRARGKVAINVD